MTTSRETGPTTWGRAELDVIDRAGEITIASRRRDGTLRAGRIVWSVRHDDAIYIRSVGGPDAAWYRGVQTRHTGHVTAGTVDRDVLFVETDHTPGGRLDDVLDAAYRAKYGTGSPVQHITSERARLTTLRVDPT